jgi:hypothetical protein
VSLVVLLAVVGWDDEDEEASVGASDDERLAAEVVRAARQRKY